MWNRSVLRLCNVVKQKGSHSKEFDNFDVTFLNGLYQFPFETSSMASYFVLTSNNKCFWSLFPSHVWTGRRTAALQMNCHIVNIVTGRYLTRNYACACVVLLLLLPISVLKIKSRTDVVIRIFSSNLINFIQFSLDVLKNRHNLYKNMSKKFQCHFFPSRFLLENLGIERIFVSVFIQFNKFNWRQSLHWHNN